MLMEVQPKKPMMTIMMAINIPPFRRILRHPSGLVVLAALPQMTIQIWSRIMIMIMNRMTHPMSSSEQSHDKDRILSRKIPSAPLPFLQMMPVQEVWRNIDVAVDHRHLYPIPRNCQLSPVTSTIPFRDVSWKHGCIKKDQVKTFLGANHGSRGGVSLWWVSTRFSFHHI